MLYQSESINELAVALSKAQNEFVTPQKRTKGFNYKYADLAEIMECIKEPLAKHGFSIVHQVEAGENLVLTSLLLHSSGQWMKIAIPLIFKSDGKVNEMQAMGSAITYARRYAISCLLNLAADKEDDDGVSSSPARSYESESSYAAAKKPSVTWGARRAPAGASV